MYRTAGATTDKAQTARVRTELCGSPRPGHRRLIRTAYAWSWAWNGVLQNEAPDPHREGERQTAGEMRKIWSGLPVPGPDTRESARLKNRFLPGVRQEVWHSDGSRPKPSSSWYAVPHGDERFGIPDFPGCPGARRGTAAEREAWTSISRTGKTPEPGTAPGSGAAV